jgi:hypothetical protein
VTRECIDMVTEPSREKELSIMPMLLRCLGLECPREGECVLGIGNDSPDASREVEAALLKQGVANIE